MLSREIHKYGDNNRAKPSRSRIGSGPRIDIGQRNLSGFRSHCFDMHVHASRQFCVVNFDIKLKIQSQTAGSQFPEPIMVHMPSTIISLL